MLLSVWTLKLRSLTLYVSWEFVTESKSVAVTNTHTRTHTHNTLSVNYFQFSLLRTAFQRLRYIFIVELFIEYMCCMTSPAEMCGSGSWTVIHRILRISERIVSAIRLHIYRRGIYRIFLLYDVTSRDVRKRTVNSNLQNIAAPRKDCGSFVDGKLRALHRRNLKK